MLTAHNWKKMKGTLLTCPCHKLYRVEAVGRSIANYAWKIKIFMIMWNWGYFGKICYFVNNCLIKMQI